jgi:hypothetical protein
MMKMNPNKAFIKQTVKRLFFAWFFMWRILLNGLITFIVVALYALSIDYFLGHEATKGILVNVIAWILLLGTLGSLFYYTTSRQTINRSVNLILS